jgi:cyclohexadieny/prephenate dehydrogenase
MAFEPFNKVALVGLGLIGSSLSHVMRREGLAGRFRAMRDHSRPGIGRWSWPVRRGARQRTAAVEGADLVILCSPVGTYGALAEEIAPALAPGCILTDVGSVKKAVVADVQPHVPDTVHFVPGHPIAGTEQSGPDAGFAGLFENKWCILTPLEGTDQAAVDRLSGFWKACGSDVDIMDPEHHDMVLAITSHLPHLIAYNIVGTAADLEEVTSSEVIKYSAGGFRDFTRIAASDPVMWRDVFLTNKDAVLEMLGRFSEDLSALQRAIRWGDGDMLQQFFTRTRAIRKGVIDAGQDTARPDFGRITKNGGQDER